MQKKTVWTILIITIAALTALFFIFRPAVEQQTKLAEANVYTMDKTIKTDKLDIIVVKAERRNTLGGSGIIQLTPPAGKVYYTINWSYADNTKEPIKLTIQPSITMIDNFGAVVEPSLESKSIFVQELKLEKNNQLELKPQMPVFNGDVFVVNKALPTDGEWYLIFKFDNKEYKMLLNK